uniref:Uncharacterized protein n=1 Tax=viral metagenome TaxID=1070528 RepID=A0A6H1ZMI8_9ZZZZ
MSNPNIKNRFVGSELLPAAGINQTFLAIADTFDTTIGRGLDTSDFLDGGIRDINIAIGGLPTEKIADSAIDPDTHLGIESISSDKLLQTAGTGVIRDYHLNKSGAASDRVRMIRFPNFSDVDTQKVVVMMGYERISVLGPTTKTGSVVFGDDSLIGYEEFMAAEVNKITIKAGVVRIFTGGFPIKYVMTPIISNLDETGFDYEIKVYGVTSEGNTRYYNFIWVATGRVAQ